jgi:hypothetical protein
MKKATKQPKWAKNLARDGWVPRIGGYRHMATEVSVIRAMTLEDPDSEPEWRVIDRKGTLMCMFSSLTEAMVFAESTVTLMEV